MTVAIPRRTSDEWRSVRLKHVCRFVGGGTPDKGEPQYWGGGIPWVSPKDMKSLIVCDSEDHITGEGLDNSAARLIEPGAILIVVRSGILRHSIPVAINSVSVTLNQDMLAMIPDVRFDPRYLARFIEGHQAELLSAWSKEGTTVESLERSLLGETIIPAPPLLQQRAIADYLDRETAGLDALVAAKGRVLELLSKKRQSLIAQAVTRGIDRTISYRDSGVSWLGEIPAHWKLVALRFLVDMIGGATPDTGRTEYWDGDTPWVSPKDMKQDEISDTGDCVSALALSETALRVVPKKSVLVVVRGMILAHSFPVAMTTGPVTINQDMKALSCRDVLDPLFLRDFLRASKNYLVSMIDSAAHGTKKLEARVLENLQVPLPPLGEQRKISDRIASDIKNLDLFGAATVRAMDLLKERRRVLISAAVTGRVDVERAA